MQDSPATEPSSRRQTVVPSRSDPLLRAATEPIGGPLGRRSAPGLMEPGFFSVERVLILLTAVAAMLAVASKFHCRDVGWSTPDQYSTVCWSAFPNAFREHQLGSVLPYLSPESTFTFSPLAGLIAAGTSWLTAAAGDGLLRQLAFFDLNAALLAAVWLALVIVLARATPRRPWDAALLAVSPLLILTAYVGWDLWAAALAVWGLWAFGRHHPVWAGLCFGVGAMAAPFVLLLPLSVVLLAIRGRRGRVALVTVGATAAGALVVLLPVLLGNSAAWWGYLSRFWTEPASASSLYGGYNLVAARMGLPLLEAGTVNAMAAVLLVLVLLGVAAVALLAPRQPRLATLAAIAVAALLIVSKFAQPWHAVWLLPLLVLALPKWRPVLLWQLAVAAHFIALMLFQSKQLGAIADAHAIDTPYFLAAALLAGLAHGVILALLLREVWRPRFDVVRRAGADDPLLGALRRG